MAFRKPKQDPLVCPKCGHTQRWSLDGWLWHINLCKGKAV